MIWENPKLSKGKRRLTKQQCLDDVKRFERDYFKRLDKMRQDYEQRKLRLP